MSRRVRLSVFAVATLCILVALVHVIQHMPAFGAHPLPYGDAINAAAAVLTATESRSRHLR
jgi:hypothetical protein